MIDSASARAKPPHTAERVFLVGRVVSGCVRLADLYRVGGISGKEVGGVLVDTVAVGVPQSGGQARVTYMLTGAAVMTAASEPGARASITSGAVTMVPESGPEEDTADPAELDPDAAADAALTSAAGDALEAGGDDRAGGAVAHHTTTLLTASAGSSSDADALQPGSLVLFVAARVEQQGKGSPLTLSRQAMQGAPLPAVSARLWSRALGVEQVVEAGAARISHSEARSGLRAAAVGTVGLLGVAHRHVTVPVGFAATALPAVMETLMVLRMMFAGVVTTDEDPSTGDTLLCCEDVDDAALAVAAIRAVAGTAIERVSGPRLPREPPAGAGTGTDAVSGLELRPLRVPLRVTASRVAAEPAMGKSPNKHNRAYMKAMPAPRPARERGAESAAIEVASSMLWFASASGAVAIPEYSMGTIRDPRVAAAADKGVRVWVPRRDRATARDERATSGDTEDVLPREPTHDAVAAAAGLRHRPLWRLPRLSDRERARLKSQAPQRSGNGSGGDHDPVTMQARLLREVAMCGRLARCTALVSRWSTTSRSESSSTSVPLGALA